MILSATHISTGATIHFELVGESHRLGRSTTDDPENKLSVSFDPKLSRRVAVLEVKHGAVFVRRDQSRHPLFHEGQDKENFHLTPGQRFSSGETVFELQEELAHTLTVNVMERVNQSNPDKILEVLLGLQELLNRGHETSELAEQVATRLKDLLTGAEVVLYSLNDSGEPQALNPSTLRPSRSLLADCLKSGLPAYHVYSSRPGIAQPTQSGGESWALAAPLLCSFERLVLYAVGLSQETPGELERSALALVAKVLGEHLEGRHSLFLRAQVEAKTQTNEKLRALLETIEGSLSLEQEQGYQRVFLAGARRVTGARVAHFELDLEPYFQAQEHSRIGSDPEGNFLAVAFEHSWPEGILCRNPSEQPFQGEDANWLVALMGFAETVFENRRLHKQVTNSLQKVKDSQGRLIRSSQWVAAGRLAANAAHELNTPLGPMKLSAETALAFLREKPEAAEESLRLILRSVDRCKAVTERFLVYSRPKESKSREAFILANVLEDSLSSLNPTLESRAVNIENGVQPELQVMAEPQDCYWAITNLLKNSIEALSDLPVRQIRLHTTMESDSVTLVVADSGPGVPQENQEKVFEPFFSTKKIGEGNGLGLAISRRNARSWGGDLCYQPDPNGGARFALSFPLARQD